MLTQVNSARGLRGFTLVELMVTISVMAILMLAAAPSLGLWIFNTRVRTSAEALQNGLRLAQAEAVRQGRVVVFGLTNAVPELDAARTANGTNWTIQTVPLTGAVGDAARFVRGGPAADVTGGVVIEGPAAVCFSSLGNLITLAGPGCAAATTPYGFSHPSGDRALRVELSLNGRVRMCDPTRDIATAPDGCTTP